MRASMIVFAGAALLTVSAFAADTRVTSSEQRTVVASMEMKQVKKAPKAAKTPAPVRVWSLEMSCCEPQ